jgi:hypothetical protein
VFQWLPAIASENRNSPRLRLASFFIASCLLALTVLDIMTTNLGLAAGAIEGNKIMRWFQDNMGQWWYLPRLIGQLIPAIMIVWYPHRYVLIIITPVIPILAYFVWNNARLAGLF